MLVRAIPSRRSTFSPTSIAGLVRWYAADELGLADNALVSLWADASPSGADLTAAGTDRPTIVHDRWNGKPGVVFSGAQVLASASATGRPTTDATVFVVGSHQSHGSSFPQYLSWCGSGDTSHGLAVYGDSVAQATLQPPTFIVRPVGGSWGGNQSTSAFRPDRDDPVLLACRKDGGDTKIRVDRNADEVDSGTDADLDYGTGTISLALGSVGGIGFLAGTIYEVLIYDSALSDADVELIEEYLDSKWRVTLVKARWLGMFNGHSGVGGSAYGLGVCWSPDAKRFKRSLANPVLTGSGTGVHAPTIAEYSGGLLAFFDVPGTGGVIKRSTSADGETWTAATTVIGLGAAGSDYDSLLLFPHVQWVRPGVLGMWVGGQRVLTSKYKVLYTESTDDGETWDPLATIIGVGGVGDWDEDGNIPGASFFDGDLWHHITGGFADVATQLPTEWGHWTALQPEGPYTEDAGNPILQPDMSDATASEALTANTAAGSRTVTVADTSAFDPHEQIVLGVYGGNFEVNRILTIDSGTQLTLEIPSTYTHTTAAGAVVRRMSYQKIIPRAIHRHRGALLAFGSSWSLHSASFDREVSPRWTAMDVAGPWTADRAHSYVMTIFEATSKWDGASSENLSVIPRPVGF